MSLFNGRGASSAIFDFQYIPDIGGVFSGEMLLMHLKPAGIL